MIVMIKHARNLLVDNTKSHKNSPSISTRYGSLPLRASEMTVITTQRSLFILKYAYHPPPPKKKKKKKITKITKKTKEKKHIVHTITTFIAVGSHFKHFISSRTFSDLS